MYFYLQTTDGDEISVDKSPSKIFTNKKLDSTASSSSSSSDSSSDSESEREKESDLHLKSLPGKFLKIYLNLINSVNSIKNGVKNNYLLMSQCHIWYCYCHLR